MTETAVAKIEGEAPAKTGLDLLRVPFPKNLVGKLPKPTQAQTDAVKADFKKGVRCKLCGGWHHPDVVHLDYVGHAALTDRLLDADPRWHWEPLAVGPDGTPVIDANGGLWIKLTVCNMTRIGYGDAQGKKGGNAVKEAIGDALRNAAMRFGAALDLWHKGELHAEDTDDETPAAPASKAPEAPSTQWHGPLDFEALKSHVTRLVNEIKKQTDIAELKELVQVDLEVINQCTVDHPVWAGKLDKLIKQKTEELKGSDPWGI